MDYQIFTNIDDLRSLPKDSSVIRAEVMGYYNKDDGGGGIFYWEGSNTNPDNGGTIIKNNSITTGRWVREVTGIEFNVLWFGAKRGFDYAGKTFPNFDSSTAFNEAIDYCFQNFIGGVVTVPSGFYKANISLKRGVELRGAGAETTWITAYTDDHIINWDTNIVDKRHNYFAKIYGLRIGNTNSTFSNARGINMVADINIIYTDQNEDKYYIDRPTIDSCVVEYNAAEGVYVEGKFFGNINVPKIDENGEPVRNGEDEIIYFPTNAINFVQNLRIINTQIQYNDYGGLYLTGKVIETTIQDTSIIKNGFAGDLYSNLYIGYNSQNKDPMRVRFIGGIINNANTPIGNSVRIYHASSVSFCNVDFENGKISIEGNRTENIAFREGCFSVSGNENLSEFFNIDNVDSLVVQNTQFKVSGNTSLSRIFNFPKLYLNYKDIDISNCIYPNASHFTSDYKIIDYSNSAGRNLIITSQKIPYINNFIGIYNDTDRVLANIYNKRNESVEGIPENSIVALAIRDAYSSITIKHAVGNIYLKNNSDKVLNANEQIRFLFVAQSNMKGWYEL